MIKVALAGNPNSGKTTLFNSLTGSTAHTGNWPGVTVDKREGKYRKLVEEINIVDLPGIYSLSPYTPEEVVSRNYIIDEKPNVVIDVVDATNLERNLYLTTQLLEIDVPVIVALNMSDVLRKEGSSVDINILSKQLGVPVVEISALRNENLDFLMQEVYLLRNTKRKGKTVIEDEKLAHLINDIKIAIKAKGVDNPLFHAVKLVELDELETEMHPDLVNMVEEFKEYHSDGLFGNDYVALIADARYNYITKHYSASYKTIVAKEKLTTSDKIDRVLTHRIWSLFIFAGIMFMVFHFTFSNDLFFIGRIGALITGVPHEEYQLINNPFWVNFFGAFPEGTDYINGIPSIGVWLQSYVERGFDLLSSSLASVMPETWYTSLLLDGLIGAIGSVAGFIPVVMTLFLFIAILEDSGYMARVAFILDRAFRRFGLSGRAFIPMLTSFGCAVPGIMGARTIEDKKERNVVIRLLTCFPCGAKAEILAFLSLVPSWFGLTISGEIFVSSVYFGSFAIVIIFALIMKLFTKSYKASAFIMELPSYHLPQAHNVGALLWDKFKHYLIKAGTIIAASSIVIWFLSSFNWNLTLGMVEVQNSMLADLGKGLAYFYYPLGWSTVSGGHLIGWEYSVATLTGLVAKENVVATISQLFDSQGIEYIPLTAAGLYSFAFYNLLTIPCIAAIGAAYGEQNKKEFTITILWWFFSSYVICTFINVFGLIYNVALWAGILLTVVFLIMVGFAGFFAAKKTNYQEKEA